MTLVSQPILGSRIDCTSYRDACDRILHWASDRRSCYVIAANVHVVMTAYWQKSYRNIVNHAALVTPDGMPLVLALRLLGRRHQTRVYGPDLMLAVCDRAAQEQISIYLYGGTEETLEKLAMNLKSKFPALSIAGTYAPPFRPLTEAEEAQDCDRVAASGSGIVLVGLGCPKQEQWMARQVDRLPAVMIGVGAAFSFHSGEVSQAPRWMMALSLEWLYRLWAEPKRLWKRYLINNPAFLVLLTLQLLQTYGRRFIGLLTKM
ncbi:WecB/TagA/CpsF family glycosyltransferase [Alkalinema pantanalense CENA528]|uniref:WecB/TagA/CpsF family glycosyltransferase n=1 Tax=Alkalinema pantanalense TaxID=1620705 RepID=UPI003D6DFF19